MYEIMQVRVLYVALGVLALILGANMFAGRRREGALRAAHDSLVVAVRDGDRAASLAEFLRARASQAEARADAADSAATVLAHRAARAEAVYRVARDTAPADCASLVAAADTALAVERERGDSLASALQSQRKATADTRTALDSVRASYERLRTAATTLDRAVQPSWREKLIPKLGIGAAAGLDPFTRRPAVAAGITLGWTF